MVIEWRWGRRRLWHFCQQSWLFSLLSVHLFDTRDRCSAGRLWLPSLKWSERQALPWHLGCSHREGTAWPGKGDRCSHCPSAKHLGCLVPTVLSAPAADQAMSTRPFCGCWTLPSPPWGAEKELCVHSFPCAATAVLVYSSCVAKQCAGMGQCVAPAWGKFTRTFNRHELFSATALLWACKCKEHLWTGVRLRHHFQREIWALDCIFS